jgi:hypothetical protein
MSARAPEPHHPVVEIRAKMPLGCRNALSFLAHISNLETPSRLRHYMVYSSSFLAIPPSLCFSLLSLGHKTSYIYFSQRLAVATLWMLPVKEIYGPWPMSGTSSVNLTSSLLNWPMLFVVFIGHLWPLFHLLLGTDFDTASLVSTPAVVPSSRGNNIRPWLPQLGTHLRAQCRVKDFRLVGAMSLVVLAGVPHHTYSLEWTPDFL